MVFIVKPISAQLAEDHDFFGKSDPYCIILIGAQKFQSKPHSGGGQNPKWNETFKFDVNATELKIQVYDEDVGKDDFYGEGTLDLSKWLANPGKAESDCVEIFEKKKKTGQVVVSIEYQGPVVQNAGGFNNPGKLGY